MMKRLLKFLLVLAFVIGAHGASYSQAAAIQLPQTGQTLCYDATGATIPCAGTGQDGELQTGVVWPTPRFNDNGDQTITDNLTGLVWSKDANPAGTAKTWQQALDYIKALNASNYLGHNDWRLPNINEMWSLVSKGMIAPPDFLTGQGFTNVLANYFWSSSNSYADLAWFVRMDVYVMYYYKSYQISVWPVRGGLSGTQSLPKTGNSTCSDETGIAISCVGTGQDGAFQVGIAWPNPRFTHNSIAPPVDPTITDNLTGLVWSKDANPAGVPMTWQQSLDYIKNLNSSNHLGHNDWRLPNINELNSLINRGSVDNRAWLANSFDNVQTNAAYWSSNSYAGLKSNAWIQVMDGSYEAPTSKMDSNYAWPVRGGQTGGIASLSLSTTSKDYGNVTTSTISSPQVFTINNSGTADLVVSAITLNGGNSGMFNLSVGDGTGGTCGTTPIIAPAASCTVSANFTPATTGSKTTALRITSNDPTNLIKDVTLTGSGVLPTYTIGTSVVGGNGTISCDSPITSGDTSSCTISPNANYHLATFADNTVNKLASIIANTYSISNVTADHTVTGTFVIDTHTVSFSSNGGSAVNSQTVNYNATAVAPANPTKTGYTFDGWYSDSSLNTAFSFSTSIVSDTALYAKWTINNYTVSFSSNGGGTVINQIVAYNNTATTPTAPTRVGYTFVGWYSDSGQTSAFNFGTLITADTTIYAKWFINSYAVSFSSNGGSAVSSQAVNFNATAVAPTNPTKTGYTFDGWYSDSSLATAFNLSTSIVADTTLYAKWTINNYTVSLTAGTGSSNTPSAPQTVSYGNKTNYTITPDAGYGILSISGCNGTLSGTTYATGAIVDNCTITVVAVRRNANSGVNAAPTMLDALKVLQAVVGSTTLTDTEKVRYDVAPLSANGVPLGNGAIDAADVIAILRRSVGIGSW